MPGLTTFLLLRPHALVPEHQSGISPAGGGDKTRANTTLVMHASDPKGPNTVPDSSMSVVEAACPRPGQTSMLHLHAYLSPGAEMCRCIRGQERACSARVRDGLVDGRSERSTVSVHWSLGSYSGLRSRASRVQRPDVCRKGPQTARGARATRARRAGYRDSLQYAHTVFGTLRWFQGVASFLR